MRRGGQLRELDDGTPLDGPGVEVEPRIGWLVRTARLTSGIAPRLQDLADQLGTNATRLHRLETGAQRDGGLVDAYERVLELPAGSLRAPVDIVCRTFETRVRDRDPGSRITTVAELSELTERLLAVAGGGHETVPGGTWLEWARAMAQPAAIGLPLGLARILVLRLVEELSRAVGTAYPTRYEALALLRCSAYGDVVLEVAREVVADPHAQSFNDLLSAVGEDAGRDAVAWCVSLLSSPRPEHVHGGALALENMAAVSRDPAGFWAPLLAPAMAAYNEAGPSGTAWQWLSHLLRLVPAPVRASGAVRPAHPLAPEARVEDWSRSRLNQHWSDCEARADAVATAVGLPEQPMLARLVFDIAFSRYETRAVTAYLLLKGLPRIVTPVVDELVDLAGQHPDPVVRRRAARRTAGLQDGSLPAGVTAWLDDPGLRAEALRMHGTGGVVLGEDLWRSGVADTDTRRATLQALGLAGHPALRDLVAADDQPHDVRGGAAWWLRVGPRLVL